MANIDRPNGFRPRKTLSGAPVSQMIRKYAITARSAGDASGDVYIGDVVAMDDSGVIDIAPSASVDIIGVVVGVGTDSTEHGEAGMFDADNLEQRYLPDAEAGYIWVCPADGVLFEVQTGADLDLLPGMGADFGLGAVDLVGTETNRGDTTTSWSQLELSSANATGGDVRVVEDVTTPDNDTSLTNARHLVAFLNTRFGSNNA